MQANRTVLLRWSVLFLLGNVILFWCVAVQFLFANAWLQTLQLSLSSKLIIHVFSTVAYLGQVGLLTLLLGIILLPLACFVPNRHFVFSVSILLVTFAAFVIFIDSETYRVYRFHLNGPILELAVNGLSEQVWEISPIETIILSSIAVSLLIVEMVIGWLIWRYLMNKIHQKVKLAMIGVILGSLLLSYGILILSSGSVLNRILNTVARSLPFYTETFTTFMPTHITQLAINRLPGNFLQQQNNVSLNYPLKKVQCNLKKKPKNLLIIVIDTWRYDMMNAVNTPTLNAFAKKSWNFTHHFSGGNATAPGIFSLFYSLPASYWSLMKKNQHGPILIDELIRRKYQMGIFSSATLHLPAFDETVFSAVHPLRIVSKGETAYERDQSVTRDFQQFLATQRDPSRPFFGFLFYDAVHSYCSFQEDLKPLQPAIENCNHMDLSNDTDPTPYFNRYKNALTLVDQEIKRVFATLEAKHLLEDTVILITGDHGEEFNDNHQGFWGHASNFTQYQVQTPLIVYWPGSDPKVFHHETSHFDIVPTLMNELLGCQGKVNTYSLGRNLFDTSLRPYLISGSYTGYAVIKPKSIAYITLFGDLEVQHATSAPNPEASFDKKTLRAVFKDVQRFLRR